MPKKNKMSLPSYYVFYNKASGDILAVSNELNSNYEHILEVSFEQYDCLVSGTWKFKDYLIGYKRLPDDNTVLSVIPRAEDGYLFRNGVFEWILPTNKQCEVTVNWNSASRSWEFLIDNKAKLLYSIEALPPQLIFYITLETDLDFLIRTIAVSVNDLMNQSKVVIPFISSFETDINKVSIGSRLVFKSYNLKVTNE